MHSTITRRDFVRTAALAAPLYALPHGARSAEETDERAYAYVGSYTPNGGGIYLFRIDSSSGALQQQHVFDDISNPSWLAINPARTHLYAVSEVENFDGRHEGAVVTYGIDAATREIRRLGAVRSGGGSPAYVSVHPAGRFVFVANYGGGNVAVLPVAADGTLGEATDVRPSIGARHHARQISDPPGQFAVSDHEAPHVRMVAADPSGQFVIANDAGLDLTLIWRFDEKGGLLLPADVPVAAAPAGTAPRHFAFHPNARNFYNLYEHDGKVAVYDFDAASGALRLKQVQSTLPPRFAGSNLSSELLITADGRFMYVANRLHNAITVLAIQSDGQLRSVAETWTRAASPRSLTIDPTGQFLYCCNQKGDSITSFRINAATGTLTFTGNFEPVGSPAIMTIY